MHRHIRSLPRKPLVCQLFCLGGWKMLRSIKSQWSPCWAWSCSSPCLEWCECLLTAACVMKHHLPVNFPYHSPPCWCAFTRLSEAVDTTRPLTLLMPKYKLLFNFLFFCMLTNMQLWQAEDQSWVLETAVMAVAEDPEWNPCIFRLHFNDPSPPQFPSCPCRPGTCVTYNWFIKNVSRCFWSGAVPACQNTILCPETRLASSH